jgi:hypothetical protein
MSKFLGIFTGSPNSPQGQAWQKLDEATRKERTEKGMKAWHDWMAKHASVISETGGPLGKTKKVSNSGVADIANNLSAFIIVEANSHEAAAKLFENHPHFSIFPGDSVEIMPVMPIPGN